jgi:hypothetical protein
MPKFTVEHSTDRSVDSAYEAVKTILSKAGEIQKFDAKAKVTFNEANKTCHIAGGQFKADMNVSAAGTGSKVAIIVDLPFLLTPFKGKVQETLQKMLAKHLA